MQKPVEQVNFWKERLELAKKQGNIHYSVYLANPTLWKTINDTHKEIIQKEILPSDNVLDIGCGYGRMSELLENYTGVDISPDFIDEARKLYPTKTFMVADISKLPFDTKQFDVGVAVSIKNMILGNVGEERWLEIEREIKRVCKKVLILEYGQTEDYQDNKESIGIYEIL